MKIIQITGEEVDTTEGPDPCSDPVTTSGEVEIENEVGLTRIKKRNREWHTAKERICPMVILSMIIDGGLGHQASGAFLRFFVLAQPSRFII